MKTKLLLSAFLLCLALVSTGQWTQTLLLEAKIRMGGATLGTKAFFAGGESVLGSNWFETDKVEIYDLATDTWQLDYLTQARTFTIGVTCRDRVFFAGGIYNFPNNTSSRVDIYNSFGLWDSQELSIPRFALSAVSNDSLILFAGGGDIILNTGYDVVDIYDITTGQWTVDHLSACRAAMGSVVAGDMAFFAGGDCGTTWSNRVDIYHFSTGTWTIDSLSLARSWVGAAAVGSKVLFAGGGVEGGELSKVVDIYDIETGTWEKTAELSVARGFFGQQQGVTICGKAYFVGGTSFTTDYDTIDVYDPVANEWSVMTMPNRLTDNAVVAIDSSLLIAGGFTYTTYPYGEVQNNVDIWTDPTVGLDESAVSSQRSAVNCYPNPSSGHILLGIPYENLQKSLLATIYNLQGQAVFSQMLEPGDQELNVKLPDGVYLLNIISDDASQTKLITIYN
jgi:hypothetical protein